MVGMVLMSSAVDMLSLRGLYQQAVKILTWLLGESSRLEKSI